MDRVIQSTTRAYAHKAKCWLQVLLVWPIVFVNTELFPGSKMMPIAAIRCTKKGLVLAVDIFTTIPILLLLRFLPVWNVLQTFATKTTTFRSIPPATNWEAANLAATTQQSLQATA